MSDTILIGVLALALLNLGLLLLLLFRPPGRLTEGIRKAVEEDLRKGREEAAGAARTISRAKQKKICRKMLLNHGKDRLSLSV